MYTQIILLVPPALFLPVHLWGYCDLDPGEAFPALMVSGPSRPGWQHNTTLICGFDLG